MISGEPTRLQAFWIDRKTVAIQAQHFQASWSYSLASGDNTIPLTPNPAGLTAAQAKQYPQLAGYAVFRIPSSVPASTLRQILKHQVVLSATDKNGAVKYLTGVQHAGVLDDLFYYSGPLGATFEHNVVAIRVWAPTAQSVKLFLFDDEKESAPAAIIPMSETSGVWRAEIASSWAGKYYLLSVRVYVPSLQQIVENIVTDPYSADLGSKRYEDADHRSWFRAQQARWLGPASLALSPVEERFVRLRTARARFQHCG